MNTKLLRLLIAPVAFALLFMGQAPGVQYTKDGFDAIRKNLAEKKAVLIDVREPGEWQKGHLADADLLPLSKLRQTKVPSVQQEVEQSLPKDKIIYCHCASGGRVVTAAHILGRLGYEVRPLQAGYQDLRAAGFPAAEK